jgi:hypothetical protein
MESSQYPNLWGQEFKGINLEQWIDEAHKTITLNVLQSEKLYAMAVDYFENSMITYWLNNEEYKKNVLDKESELKKSNKTEPERARELANYKIRELTLLIDKKSIKKVDIILDPDAYWEYENERLAKLGKKVDSDAGRGEQPSV